MTDKIVVLSTCASKEEAEKIARMLVEKRLAACVNTLAGLRSTYWWQNAIEQSDEWLLIIKTRRDLVTELRAELEKSHSYDTPEVLAIPVVDGAERYLAWMERELAPREHESAG
jgi:periplasmic divalent cation tolerance protein